MIQKITADRIYTMTTDAPVEKTVIITNETGKILAIEPLDAHDPASVRTYTGTLTPGFVNTHCHLELSHMKGLVNTGVSLIPFITGVVTKRAATQEIIQDAIQKAIREMVENGIVAVGDISNTSDTFAEKAKGQLRYYTFIEMFDFLQNQDADKMFSQYEAVFYELHPAKGSRKSVVPHAPYSVSERLFKKIYDMNHLPNRTVSIHNQETPPENELFLHGRGAFYAFYQRFGISLDTFQPTGQTAIHYALQHLNPANRNLLVHNTLTTADDLKAAQDWSENIFFATCANANLYIENRLPNYQTFIDAKARMTIGTDSLTSNWQLSILEEMKTIQKFQSYVSTDVLMLWATLNGAKALGFEDTLGSIEVGKTPGLNLLNLEKEGLLKTNTIVKKII
jgi:cytosine/adenosine deaminase-related metal-dependent hydrolase